MGKLDKGLLKTVGAVLAVLCVVFLVAYTVASNTAMSGEMLGIAQALVTIVAIVAGGLFAAYKWQVFRESEPHLTITHEVSHRTVGESYVPIAVTASLHNSSKVHIELLKGTFSLQLLSPTTDELVESLYDEVFERGCHTALQWPSIDESERGWGRGELTVEPGESHSETIEFIALGDVETVMIYTYFYNPNYTNSGNAAQGWGATTVHDIIESRESKHSQGGCDGGRRQEHQESGRDKGNQPQTEAGES
ncbi:MAG: hypothetical protein OXE05_06165 [Chloroflexi bacterium]|nr:hypothetical protein [Chloroflexota bacterium]